MVDKTALTAEPMAEMRQNDCRSLTFVVSLPNEAANALHYALRTLTDETQAALRGCTIPPHPDAAGRSSVSGPGRPRLRVGKPTTMAMLSIRLLNEKKSQRL